MVVQISLKIGIKKYLFPPFRFTAEEHKEIQDGDWVAGAFMLLRREVFNATGGFDEKIFLYGEECEWCYRIKKKGWKIVYYPLVYITHIEKASTAPLNEMKIYEKSLSGKEYFFQKHYGMLKANVYKNLALLSAIIKLPIWCLICIFFNFRSHAKDRMLFQLSSIRWYFSKWK